MSWGKYGKIQNLFHFHTEKINKADKDSMRILQQFFTKLLQKFIYNVSSFADVVEYLGKEIHKTKCKNYNCFLKYESVSDKLVKYKSSFCNESCKKIDEKLHKRFTNTFTFSNNDINKFILVLRKGICLC